MKFMQWIANLTMIQMRRIGWTFSMTRSWMSNSITLVNSVSILIIHLSTHTPFFTLISNSYPPLGIESMSEEDIDSIKMFNLIREGHISWKTHSKFTTFWGDHIHSKSLYKLFCQMTELSNVETVMYDCCINSCCVFTGTNYETAELCPYCHEPRFDKHHQSRNRFKYILLTCCIQSMFLNHSLTNKMMYWSNFEFNADSYEDIFSGSHY